MENQGVISKLQGNANIWKCTCGKNVGQPWVANILYLILLVLVDINIAMCPVFDTYVPTGDDHEDKTVMTRLYYTNISDDKDSRDKILTSSIDANKHHPP